MILLMAKFGSHTPKPALSGSSVCGDRTADGRLDRPGKGREAPGGEADRSSFTCAKSASRSEEVDLRAQVWSMCLLRKRVEVLFAAYDLLKVLGENVFRKCESKIRLSKDTSRLLENLGFSS